MGFWQKMLAPFVASGAGAVPVRNSATGEMILIRTPQELEEALRTGNVASSGQSVTTTTAMRVAAVYACVRIISGAVANLPVQVKRRVDDRTREDASDHNLWELFHRRPNRWQKPAQFKRMLQAHVLLRGNAYALKVRGVGGRVIGLIPMNPDRMKVSQNDLLELEYVFTRKNGKRVTFNQDEVLHLIGLSLDGITGLSVISYARETIGLSLSMEQHGGAVFKNGANVSGAFKLPAGRTLTDESAKRLRADLDDFRAGGNREGKVILLEDGLDYQQMALNAEDAQWIEARKLSRSDIAMFFGVPPHLIGDTEKTTSWGSGIEQQGQAFVTFTLEDHLTMWEQALNADCLDPVRDSDIYVRFNRNALVRGDLKARWEAHRTALQWGVRSPNEVRELEDENPREGGDIYYPPPNMTADEKSGDGDDNVDQKTA